jgi:hypothetical protein
VADKTQEEINALDADHILNHPLFKQAFEQSEKNLIDKMKFAGMGVDAQVTLRISLSLQLLEGLKEDIYGYIENAEYQSRYTEKFLENLPIEEFSDATD